ncbi:hypothetical protein QNO07_09395 [Streptomyces sp. 549]|uniref:hypothetical protein n=1 Tax=Streptomyces sp. 549 TaxID=3049076 RepID=UPI0024C2ACEB|nr:hypothetical protein [Streptomyces sp. 549]MDK1473633.1 hypothetical protein [Streptomyces sp. 549]
MSTDVQTPRDTDDADHIDDELWALAQRVGDRIPVPAKNGLPPGDIVVVHAKQHAADEWRVRLREAGPAMVVLTYTGRAVGLTARGIGTVCGWTATGAGAVTVLAWEYLRARDEWVREGGHIDKDGKRRIEAAGHRKVIAMRRQRWRFLAWAAPSSLTGVVAAGWSALVFGAKMTAAESMWITPTVMTAGLLATLTVYGRYRRQYRVTAGDVFAPEHHSELEAGAAEEEDDGEPYPLKHATDTADIEECVHRALTAEGIGVRTLSLRGQHAWGCEVDVTLKGKGSTPAKVNSLTGSIDTHLGLPKGGTLVEPDMDESDHITLRLVQSDPFAGMPDPVVHVPGSLSVRDLVAYGRGMDGAPLEFRLRGMSMLVIGSSGSAKTKGALRSLLEAITASRDAVAVEMDPVKDGLTEFSGVMAAPPIRGGEACTEWLRHLRDMASARNRVKNRLDMGDLWEPSPEHPSIYAVVDEFIYLPQEAKDLAIELLRVGRETGVHLIFAAQEATEDALGDAVASAVTYRIMLASRSEDVRLVFGQGASGDGYRPDRLRPAVDDVRVYDAGKFYIKGPGFERPILWRWHRISRDQVQRAVADRTAQGRPWFDHDTLAAAGLLHLEKLRPGAGPASGRSVVADAIEAMAELDVDRMQTDALAAALADAWPDAYDGLDAEGLKTAMKGASAGAPIPLGVKGEDGKWQRGYKREALAALPR